MPPIRPISRRNLIRNLRRLGFEGPYPRTRHECMVKDDRLLILPNPHRGDIGRALLMDILRQAGISRAEWELL